MPRDNLVSNRGKQRRDVVQRNTAWAGQTPRPQHVPRKKPTTPTPRFNASRMFFIKKLILLIYILLSASAATARIPPLPSSDDDNQPALVRYARLKEREHASTGDIAQRPGAPRFITSPPNPEKWALKDTSVNVATAFHQAASASADMQAYSSHHNNAWASGSNRPNPTVPRSTSVEYEKEAQQTSLKSRLAPPPSRLNNSTGAGLRTIPTQSTRRPVSKTASVHHVPDSEAEAENDADVNGRAKSPFDQIIDVAVRTLAPATFYLRQRSQEPDASADVSNANGQHSSYDYSAEEREFQANRTKPNSISAQRKNRMSVDNKAYKPVSDGESDEEYSDDDKGRRRRKKKKKDGPVGGPLTTLPIMPADKRKKRRSRGGKSGTGDEGEDSESDGNTAAEKVSNHCLSKPTTADQCLPGIQSTSLSRQIFYSPSIPKIRST